MRTAAGGRALTKSHAACRADGGVMAQCHAPARSGLGDGAIAKGDGIDIGCRGLCAVLAQAGDLVAADRNALRIGQAVAIGLGAA